MIYFAIACFAISLGLGRCAFTFKYDAAPVGAYVLCGSAAFMVAGIFLLGILLGQVL